MKVLSLFAGCGISDVGFERAGCQSVAQVEIDTIPSSVRKRHFPDAEHYGDIHEFDAKRFRGAIDVVAGGFPCQDYSTAGRMVGLAGDKGALWWQYLRVVSEAQPDFVWGENVPGLLYANGGRSFHSIVSSLVKCGYSVCWRVLDLQYFRVPQRRRRLLIVGTRLASARGGRASLGIFEPGSLPGDIASGQETTQGNPSTAGDLPAAGSWRRSNGRLLLRHTPDVAGSLTAGGGGAGGGSTSNNELDFLVGTLTANTGGMTRAAGNANELDFCIPDASTGRVRRLLPVEAERLMGLPDGYTRFGVNGEEISRTRRYMMLGNGWSVPQARWLAERFVSE